MKKIVFTVLIVIMLLVGTFSVSMAKDAGEAKIWFKNATGSPLELSLTDSAGNVVFYSLDTNITQEMMVPGMYAYFASASCGNISGTWNLQPNQTYSVDCGEAGVFTAKESKNSCADHGWYVYDGGYWFPSWTTWGRYHWDTPYHFLWDISGGMTNIQWYEWGCWNGDPMYNYGW